MSTTGVSLIIGGMTYAVNNGSPFYVISWTGLGALPITRKSQQGPLQDGETDLGWRGLARFFSLTFMFENDDLPGRISNRRTLLRYIAPRDGVTKIRFSFDGTLYQIDAHPISEAGDLASDDVNTLSKVPVRWKASDPTFYDPTAVSVTFGLAGGADALEVPLEVPMVVGASTLDQTVNVAYTGDVDAYPELIRITGPITNCVLTNEETGDKLDFTGTTIAAGDYYDIDCRYANKTIVNAAGVSKIADLTGDSDLATFRLVAAVDGTASRTNTFSVTGSSVTAATEVEMTYYTRFSGI